VTPRRTSETQYKVQDFDILDRRSKQRSHEPAPQKKVSRANQPGFVVFRAFFGATLRHEMLVKARLIHREAGRAGGAAAFRSERDLARGRACGNGGSDFGVRDDREGGRDFVERHFAGLQ
jgi:hypothetical protein